MKEWRIIKIQRMSGGGFLAELCFPSTPTDYGPPMERAFSTAKELQDWLADVLGVGIDYPVNYGEPQ